MFIGGNKKQGLWSSPLGRSLLIAVVFGSFLLPSGPLSAAGSELSDEPIPLLKEEDLPERAAPLLELGTDFLGTGNIPRGFTLPTGAVWTPALWVFGDARFGFNYFDNGGPDELVEAVASLDLFFNLRLTGTERLLLGFSPLRDEEKFVNYQFEPDDREGFNENFDFEPTTLFFEGEFGEIFPNLDEADTGSYDWGFAIGRQPIFFQNGMMFNDTIDAVGLTRDTIVFTDYSPDTRLTGLFGWSEIHRADNNEDKGAYFVGLFSETDVRKSTFNLDAAYVFSDGPDNDGLYLGASSVQRIGLWNTNFAANGSIALEGDSDAVDDGLLLFTEISTTPFGTEDVFYTNLFGAVGNYTSAARGPNTGGPLGQTGLLFAAVGLGRYGAPLSNRADSAVGGSIGYQMFFNQNRTQLTAEIGGRLGTRDRVDDEAAVGFRFQQAIGSRYILRLDGFLSEHEERGTGGGARTEFLVRF